MKNKVQMTGIMSVPLTDQEWAAQEYASLLES